MVDVNNDAFLTSENIRRARGLVKREGFAVFENAYSSEFCRSVIDLIDRHRGTEDTELNYAGSELRIWHAERLDVELAMFRRACDQFVSGLAGRDIEAFNLLAIRNVPIAPNDEASRVGRWHLDSFRKMYKVFLFLTDTTDASGPFEFVPRTHTMSFKTRMALRGAYFTMSDLLTGRRAYQRLTDSWVDGLSAAGHKPLAVTCKTGTVMVVDSSVVHRARPCAEGARYALTAYYRSL